MGRPAKAESSVAPFTIADADAAVADAYAKRLEALAAVTDACRAFPGISDRRVIADLQPLSGYESERLATPNLSKDLRAELERRVAFHAAVAAETEAINALSAAEKVRDDMQAAADLVALGDGRAALRDVIATCVVADRLHRSNAEAHERAEAAVIDTYGEQSEAERALEKAKKDTPPRLAALFRGEEVEDAPTVEQAEAALRAVQQKRVDIKVARDALEEEMTKAKARLGWQDNKVKAAVAFVVKASPEAEALFDAYVEADRRATSLRLAVDALSQAGALPDRAVAHRPGEPDRFLSHQWAAAMEGLRSDFGAPLPKVP